MYNGAPPITDEVNAGPPQDRLGKGLAKVFRSVDKGDVLLRGVNATRSLVNGSSLYAVQPLWHSPSYWSTPITATFCRLVQPNASFVNFLVYTPPSGNSAVIKQYVATVEGSALLANINFQITNAGQVMNNIQFVLGQEKCRTGPNNYPAFPHPTHIISVHGGPVVMQVQNLGANPIRAFCAFYGWTLPTYSIYGQGERTGTVDNTDG